MDALKLLKNYDCWEEILNRVEDPKDLLSCYEVWFTAQEILENKNGVMFSLILPLISRYLITDHLSNFSQMLKCRLVCKSWCKTIDKLLKHAVFDRAFSFYSGQRTGRFLQIFASFEGNPFRGSPVTLLPYGDLLLSELQVEGAEVEAEALNAHGNDWDMRNGQWEMFHMRKLRQLVERFGSKMEHVVFYPNQSNNRHSLAFCKNMEMILAHLPNLRNLQIFNMHQTCNFELKEREGKLVLYTYIRVCALEAHGFEGMVTRLIVQKYACRLESMTIGDPCGFPEEGLRMSNLKFLKLTCVDASISLNGLRQLQVPQLFSLKLKVTSNRNCVDLWPIEELFRNIDHLPIRSLSIHVPIENVFVGESGPISAEHRPYAESITDLDLYFPTGSFSLNFLLYCPNLGRMFIGTSHDMGLDLILSRHRVPAEYPNRIPELLDVNKLMEQDDYDLYHSNIWDKLPNLRGFDIRHNGKSDTVTRKEYDRRKLENGSV